MEYFKVNKLSDAVTEIEDLSQVRVFLIQGRERAAVIDTGTGIGPLREKIEELTDKPYEVICTHGHMDHAGGAWAFDRVWLAPADHELARQHGQVDIRWRYTESVMAASGQNINILTREEFLPKREKGFEKLQDGQLFDLGGITLEAVSVPGHTQGMMMILIREERTMIFGDGCNTNVFLFDENSCSVGQYKRNLLKLAEQYEDKYDQIYLSHGPALQPKIILEECIEVCDEIMAGTDDKEPYEFMGGHYTRAKKTDPATQARADGRLGNIIYNANRDFFD